MAADKVSQALSRVALRIGKGISEVCLTPKFSWNEAAGPQSACQLQRLLGGGALSLSSREFWKHTTCMLGVIVITAPELAPQHPLLG